MEAQRPRGIRLRAFDLAFGAPEDHAGYLIRIRHGRIRRPPRTHTRRTKWTQAERTARLARLYTLFAEGLSVRQIQRLTGITRATIGKYRRSYQGP